MPYEDDKEVLEAFEEETRERLADIETGLLDLEKSPGAVDGERVHAIFRAAHSIKAGAGLLKFKDIEMIAHRAENILQRVRNGELTPDAPLITALLEAFDSVHDLLGDRRAHADASVVRRRLAALERYVR